MYTQAALNALALSETVYRIMDPGGLTEAERVARQLISELPAFAQSPLRLQWSSKHSPQRCASYTSMQSTSQTTYMAAQFGELHRQWHHSRWFH